MQLFTVLTTLALAAGALATCPTGPKQQGSACGSECNNLKRCSLNNQHVVRYSYLSFFGSPCFLTASMDHPPSLFMDYYPLLHYQYPFVYLKRDDGSGVKAARYTETYLWYLTQSSIS